VVCLAALVTLAAALGGAQPVIFEPGPQHPIVGFGTSQVVLGDLDGDLDLDAVIGKSSYPNPHIRVLLNDGSGFFTDSGQTLGTQHCPIALGDLDDDGDLDLVISYPSLRVWVNDGGGLFSPAAQDLGGSQVYDVDLGDLDGDDDLDLLASMTGGGRLLMNDGEGSFTDSGQLWPAMDGRVALGDFDGDQDLDAFVGRGANFGEADEVYLNDGFGHLFDSGQSLGTFTTASVAVGDVDGDGDLDVAAGEWLGGMRLWRNNGAGLLTLDPQAVGASAHTADVRLADLDLDGDLDLILVNTNTWDPVGGSGGPARNEVWTNDGTGGFQLAQLLDPAESEQADLGDVDGDGDADLMVANRIFAAPDSLRVWMSRIAVFVDGFESGDTSAWSD
jgi:hypothetical protein